MTATTYAQHRPPILSWCLLLLSAAVLVGLLAAVAVAPRSHAVRRHGRAEVTAIRHGCDNQGPVEMWQSNSWRSPKKFFQVCPLSDGRLGIRIIECQKGQWVEKTAFVPSGELGNGTWERVYEYLSARAKPWTGNLAAMCR